ncbi:MAG: class II fumarate hydratase [Clostridiales Family XIII bacterium]|jgi:fumarate hydratase class II|nr:class II fumarate hydratase [Clostridiales Family XIII bacterium]
MDAEAGYRIEKDTMGEVKVAADRLWGAQTQRSLENFSIGWEKMPLSVIRAFAVLKKASAQANSELGALDARKAEAIGRACDEILAGGLYGHFPLSVWQTGSGTQTNMNVNEVIAHMAGLHPNDDVNMGQSSNDAFPAAMHIAAVTETEDALLPALSGLEATFAGLSERYAGIIKIGRTHLQDATPLTLGQEISAWQAMLSETGGMIRAALGPVRRLALGGTAVGTGLNARPGFGSLAAQKISLLTGREFVTAENKFHALTSRDALVNLHGAFKALAADLMKAANDVRLLSSGPRCGIGELIIPENEPGSSIMPGKVNPTQCEALCMACCQVMGNDVTIGMAASQGNFQLNVYMPVLIYNLLQSIKLLGDAMLSFDENCAKGIRPNEARIKAHLEASLMLVTCLAPRLGYENAALIAKTAHMNGSTLREEAVALGFLSASEFDGLVRPERMVGEA